MEDNHNISAKENVSCGKWSLTEEEDAFQETHGWWLQGVISIIVGSFGFIMNIITIYILSKERLNRIFFNKLSFFI